MNKITASKIITILKEIIPNPVCELDFNNNFELICAVMISAQTTDKRVNLVTPNLFKKYPTPKDLSQAEFNDVKDIISSLGMGNRLDPTKVYITTLDKTENDPVARIMRSNARKEEYDLKKINVVCSKEFPIKNDVVNEDGNTSKERHPIASMMLVPATAGIYCAYYFMNKNRKENQ